MRIIIILVNFHFNVDEFLEAIGHDQRRLSVDM